VSLGAHEENAKTLASILGIDDEDAGGLLAVGILVRAASDQHGPCIRKHIVELLKRTVAHAGDRIGGIVAAEIAIGSLPPVTGGPVVYIGVTRSEIVISCETVPRHDPHADVPEIVLLLAACYAAAMATRLAVGKTLSLAHQDTIRLPVDALLHREHGTAQPRPQIGRAYLAGAGAVGNGFVWALGTLQPVGELCVVDPKKVAAGNLNRCLLFELGDVGQSKAERLAVRAQLLLPGAKVIAHVGTIQNAPARSSGAWLERLIVGVDSRRARRRLQEELPGQVFDASTTGVEEIVFHVNAALEPGACMSCVYAEDIAEAAHERHVAAMLGVETADVQQHYVSADAATRICLLHPQLHEATVVGLAYDTLFKTMCATGTLGVEEGRTVLAPFSFVSVLAGAYLALELVHRPPGGSVVPPFNYWRASPWTSPVLELRSHRPAVAGCETCGNHVIRETVTRVWGMHAKGPG
jgi:hypothetical protein